MKIKNSFMWEDMFTFPLHGLVVTLAPEEECEGNAFGSVRLSVCMSVCLSERVTQAVLPLRRSGSGSGYGVNYLFNDSSPLGVGTEYAIKECHNLKRGGMMKKCIMTSQVCHSERARLSHL